MATSHPKKSMSRSRTSSRGRRPTASKRAAGAARTRRVTRRSRRMPTTSVVREASRLSVAGPALVKRTWWRIDGPVDPSLPDGYAYQR